MRISLMHRIVPTLVLALPLCVSSGVAQGVQSTAVQTDPVFERAQQMVTAGQDVAGRAVVDSVLAATADDTPRYAEALFWRAKLSKTAAAAERDYRRISVEYPLSPRAQESLLRLAQLEMTRGDRASARAHFERIQREHPTGTTSVRASVTLAQLAFDDGDAVAGCAAVTAARSGLTPADVELRNQVDYFGPRCANLAARDTAAKTTAPSDVAATRPLDARTDTTASTTASRPAATRSTTPASSAETRREYSVQVAAYDTRPAADALARKLTARGYAARVVGDGKPYRVRVGRYATRDRATDAAQQMGKVNVRGVVVQAEPR
jgi:cell division septation protein DedD